MNNEITNQHSLHSKLPKGHESEWIEFASLPVISGQIRVSDPMFFRDVPPSPTFAVDPGTYRVMAKIIDYPSDGRVSRLRAISHEPSAFGSRLDDVGVDFAQVGIFDPVFLDEAAEKLSKVQDERFIADLDGIRHFGVVQLGDDVRV